jgi:putative FmdB family regulatory protein
MPIYQYVCRRCAHRFEQLVRGEVRPACPTCRSADLERTFSPFAVLGGGRDPGPAAASGCGTCGDPRGPGACARD